MVSAGTSIAVITPATGEGISVSTLSVETSNRASSTATVSPTCFNQRVTVPSVTDSPSAGIVTTVPALLPVLLLALAIGATGATGAAGVGTGAGAATGAGVGAGAGDDCVTGAAEALAPLSIIANSAPTGTV